MDDITITPMGVNVIGRSEEISILKIEITMKDGKMLDFSNRESDGKWNTKYLSPQPISVKDIKEVRINGKVIPLED